ncbi:MAG: metallophosphoesterase [Trueperaceae bacterium]|nr:metallophosphoesterase [Trueperaceae bacterium]
MRIVVIGDIHTQSEKLWRMLRESGLADADGRPEQSFREDDSKLVLLGDLVHAKSRERYAEIAKVLRYDEYNPEHLIAAEQAQEAFLTEIKAFYDQLPAGKMIILMGNHDYNAVYQEQGPLRTDDVSHLEWRDVSQRELEPELRNWILDWPFEYELEGIHFAHVGPLKEHNTYDNDFYLLNRRRWIYEDRDYLMDSPYRLGVYGHTPVRGGVNIASQGRAILLDTNGYGEEYSYLEIVPLKNKYKLKMRGLFFDEEIQR